MDNAMYVGLSRQMTLRRELDILANNIANADTAGFKVESMMVETNEEGDARAMQGPGSIKFVLDDGVARDFGQGALRDTGADFDMAIEGQGFFSVQTANGERYTRDGRFTLAADGRLTTQGGDPVQGDGGDIVVDPSKGRVAISTDGTISQGATRVGKVSVVRFDDLGLLAKDGDNLLRNTSNLQPQDAPDAQVRQGKLESSNVNPVLQITRLIQVSRAYESVAKMMDQTSELSRRSIERLGRVT